MRQIAYTLLGIVLMANLIQPLTEMANACRKKIMLSSAINNSFRAAKDRSLTEESIQELNAQVDTALFYDYFSQAFCDSLSLSESGRSEGSYGLLTFDSDNEFFNPIEVEIELDEYQDSSSGKEMTKIDLHVTTDYKFDIGYLKRFNEVMSDPYTLEFERSYILSVRN